MHQITNVECGSIVYPKQDLVQNGCLSALFSSPFHHILLDFKLIDFDCVTGTLAESPNFSQILQYSSISIVEALIFFLTYKD